MLTSALTLALMATSAIAVKVTSPTSSSVWQSNGGAQTVSWETVSSDPTSFAIVLVNQGSENHLDSPVILVQNQSASSGSTTVSDPSGSWPTGVAYQINLVKSASQTDAILAQSNQFNITSGGSESSSSSSMMSSSSSSSSSSMMMTTSTASSGSATTASAAASSGVESGIPPAQSSSSSSSASSLFHGSSTGAGVAAVAVAMSVVAGAATSLWA